MSHLAWFCVYQLAAPSIERRFLHTATDTWWTYRFDDAITSQTRQHWKMAEITRFFRCVRLEVACLLVALLQSSCDRRPLILLHLDANSIPESATAFLLRFHSEAVPLFEQRLDIRQLLIPIELSTEDLGPFQIELLSVNASGCKSAVASLKEEFPSGLRRVTERPVSLTKLTTVLCPLSVELTGLPGTVISQPPGIDCKGEGSSACSTDFPAGTEVKLSAQVTGDSYPSWGTACQGPAGECVLVVADAQQVRVSFVAQDCSVDGFCRQNPLPQGKPESSVSLTATWGTTADTVYAVGQGGVVLRCKTGTGVCTRLLTGTDQDLFSVWGNSAGGVMTVGAKGTVLSCGDLSDRCELLSSGVGQTLYSAWGIDDNTVYAVGGGGTFLRCFANLRRCVSFDTKIGDDLVAVWGANASNIYAVGGGGSILRCSAQNYSCLRRNSGTTERLLSVTASRSNDVYAVGTGGTMLRCADGASSCVKLSTGMPLPYSVLSIRGAGPMYAIDTAGNVFRCDANDGSCAKLEIDAPQPLTSVWIMDPAKTYLAGRQGAIFHCSDGSKSCARLSTGTAESINSLWANDSGGLYAVGDSGIILRHRTTNDK